MTTNAQKERVEFAAIMAREFPTITATATLELMRLARRHGKLQEKACNVQVTEGHDAACEKRIRELCAKYGITVQFSGDPRGYTVKIKLPSGASNHWGGETYGVPQ